MGVFSTIILGGLGTANGKYFQERTHIGSRAREMRPGEVETATRIFSPLRQRGDEYLLRMKEVDDAHTHGVEAKEINKGWRKFQR